MMVPAEPFAGALHRFIAPFAAEITHAIRALLTDLVRALLTTSSR